MNDNINMTIENSLALFTCRTLDFIHKRDLPSGPCLHIRDFDSSLSTGKRKRNYIICKKKGGNQEIQKQTLFFELFTLIIRSFRSPYNIRYIYLQSPNSPPAFPRSSKVEPYTVKGAGQLATPSRKKKRIPAKRRLILNTSLSN
jgi:hypothetical protein